MKAFFSFSPFTEREYFPSFFSVGRLRLLRVPDCGAWCGGCWVIVRNLLLGSHPLIQSKTVKPTSFPPRQNVSLPFDGSVFSFDFPFYDREVKLLGDLDGLVGEWTFCKKVPFVEPDFFEGNGGLPCTKVYGPSYTRWSETVFFPHLLGRRLLPPGVFFGWVQRHEVASSFEDGVIFSWTSRDS